MKPNEFLREIITPLASPPVLLAMILFFALYQFAMLGFIFGLVIGAVLAAQLIVFVLPALLRYLMIILEARIHGREPDALGIELFPWVGNLWTLFPIVHVGVFVYAAYFTGAYFGPAAALGVALIYAFLLPASLVTLAMTHSALASLNPVTIFALIKRRGFAYLIGPAFIIAATWLVIRINVEFNTDLLTEFISFYFIFAGFALFGGLMRSLKLEHEVEIPLPAGIDAEREEELHLINRTAVLNHAYGIVSRGNRVKGLEHIFKALSDDPYEEAGWVWFFENMLRWENPDAALAFAQHYVHDLLRYGENVKAVKVMLRCRMINAAFKPFAEDIELAIHAAEKCHNDELATFLR